MRKLLLLCALLCAIGLHAEIRSVWALPWDINSPEAVDTLIRTALENNQNELLVEVRYRSDALYDTSRGSLQYPNPEPRSHTLKDDGFDPLSYVLEKAHAAKLKVQAWVIVFNATPSDANLIRRNYIYQNHADWLTVDASGNRSNAARQYGNYLDPGIPEVQSYLLDVFSNLASGYPELDGIHLDYIRYPEPSKGHHPISVERYKEFCRNKLEIGFNEWRILQVSSFVERLYVQLKEINPRLLITAAVFADIADANVAYAQDWPAWLRGGYIDRVYPMAYNVKYDKHLQQVSQMKLLKRDRDIIVGLRAWDERGRTLASSGGASYQVKDIAKRIDLSRELGFGGTALFSYAGLNVGNAWPQLKQLSYMEAAGGEVVSGEVVRWPDGEVEVGEVVRWPDDEVDSGKVESFQPNPVTQLSPSIAAERTTPYTAQLTPGVHIAAKQETGMEKGLATSSPDLASATDLQTDSVATASISLNPYNKEYIMDLQIPSEGNWRWEIWDKELSYKRFRYYKKGENRDFWNGQLYNPDLSKQQLNPGHYVLQLFREDSNYKYLIPLQFEAMDTQ